MSWLLYEPKIKWKEALKKEPIQSEVVTFWELGIKRRHWAKCFEQEAFYFKKIACNHGNIHIILIL